VSVQIAAHHLFSPVSLIISSCFTLVRNISAKHVVIA
jgi:hypothetical protein